MCDTIYDRIYNGDQEQLLELNDDIDPLLLMNLIRYDVVTCKTTVNGVGIVDYIIDKYHYHRRLMDELLQSYLIEWTIINDDQRLLLLSIMSEKPYTYQTEIEYNYRSYSGNDTSKIFDLYGLSIEDLIRLNDELGLDINMDRTHILDELESRPDKKLILRRLTM